MHVFEISGSEQMQNLLYTITNHREVCVLAL